MDVLLDLGRLSEVTDGDTQLEIEIASLFTSTAADYIDDLKKHFNNPNHWSSIAHALKGAASNFGAPAIAAIAKQAEHGSPDHQQLEQLEELLSATRSLLIERYGVTLP